MLVSGCHIGDCHYIDANHWTVKRVEKMRKRMEKLGIRPERLQLEWVSAAEGIRFAGRITSYNVCYTKLLRVIWFQDTSGIDVGDDAEKSELLGLGQSLIYSIQQSDVPMMLVVLRKGTAAAHYVMGGPTAIV